MNDIHRRGEGLEEAATVGLSQKEWSKLAVESVIIRMCKLSHPLFSISECMIPELTVQV